jgi:hypothetical protein
MDEGDVPKTASPEQNSARQNVAQRPRESAWLDPTIVALFTVAAGLFGNIFVTYQNNRNALEVERVKAQSSLILQAIKTGSEPDACTNLSLFVNLGLVDDTNQTIRNACHKFPQDGAPSLPASDFTTTTVTASPPTLANDGSFSLPLLPVNINDLHLGPQYVRVEKDGYVPVTAPIWMSQKDTVIPLHRSH